MRNTFLTFLVVVLASLASLAHDGHDSKNKKKNQSKIQADTAAHTHSHAGAAGGHDASHAHSATDSIPDPSREIPPNHAHSSDEFPTLHPLIVHFPIMFLLIGAAIQLVQFFVFKRELSWVVLVLLVIGFATAYISGRYMHPHTNGLTARAAQILKEHDLYADWTVWLSGIIHST